MMGRVTKKAKTIWLIILSAMAILFVCYGVQYFCKRMFFTDMSMRISADSKGTHLYQILNAIEYTKYKNDDETKLKVKRYITVWQINPLKMWWILPIPLTFLAAIGILLYLFKRAKKKMKEKTAEIEEKAGEYKRDNDYTNNRIQELGKDLRNCEAWNQSLKERIAPLDEAAKQMQTKLKEMEAEYLQKTQAKEKAHAEELSLYKEATMTKLVEIEKMKKEKEIIEKQRSDEFIL
jgi:cytochrome c-type biogenesis protein CcmH/NrfF